MNFRGIWSGFWDHLWQRPQQTYDIDLNAEYSEEQLKAWVADLAARYESPPQPAAIALETMSVSGGQPGETIDQENMNFFELREYIDKVAKSGGNVDKYMVDLYFKLSFPFAGCIFVILGIAFASGKRKPSMATGFGLTLAISFIYYGILRVGQTLGHNGVVPPMLAAQLGNIIFLAIGVFSLSRANR